VAAGALTVRVVSPEKTVFDGEAAAVVAPAWDGLVGILPGHAPMLALLGEGALSIERPGGGTDAYHVVGGVLKVERNQVTLLTEYAGSEPPPRPIPHNVVYPEEVGIQPIR
jgi:F-type H+-transporting ATPase subunit epsilon